MSDSIDVALSIDALSPKLTGIGRYCLELARGLPSSGGVGRVSFFRGSHWLIDPVPLLSDFSRPLSNSVRQKIANGYRKLRARNALVHGPNYFLPPWAESGVITVHDLSVLLYPDTHPVERVKEFERLFWHSLKRASAILTDSEAVRDEVISLLGIPSDLVHAVPLGIAKVDANTPCRDYLLTGFGLSAGSYTLSVSTFEPRKRIDRLLEAYGLLDPLLRMKIPLVLVGAAGWLNEELNEKVAIAQSSGWLKRLDYVSDEVRDVLYRGARLFVYPSCYEGFGLPPLEAMQHGVPTLVGNAGALIEISGHAARVIDAEDIEGFSYTIADALQNQEWRQAASIAGRRVADRYSWSECLARTVSVYHKANST